MGMNLYVLLFCFYRLYTVYLCLFFVMCWRNQFVGLDWRQRLIKQLLPILNLVTFHGYKMEIILQSWYKLIRAQGSRLTWPISVHLSDLSWDNMLVPKTKTFYVESSSTGYFLSSSTKSVKMDFAISLPSIIALYDSVEQQVGRG